MLAGIVTVNCVGLTLFAPTQVDPHLVFMFVIKLVPLTVSVKAALPVAIEAGLMLVMVGCGCVTVNVMGADVPPAVVTVRLTGPAVSSRLVGTVYEKVEPATRVPDNGVDPQLTTICGVKYEPYMLVIKDPWPAGIAVKPRFEIVGGGGFTVKGKPDEVPLGVIT